MKTAKLYDCFESHLTNLSIESESDETFVATVVEKYLVNMGGLGFNFCSHAEDTFGELCHEVTEMMQKKIYGHLSVDNYRTQLRRRVGV